MLTARGSRRGTWPEEVASGAITRVLVRRDLDFSDLYADPVQEEVVRLKAGGRPKTAIDPTTLYATPKDHFYPGYGSPVE